MTKLEEAEKLQGQGSSISVVCKKLGTSEQTFYRWRLKHGALRQVERGRTCLRPAGRGLRHRAP